MKYYFGILRLVSKKFRFQLYFLQALFFLTALFQVAGIASIAPFIGMLSTPEIVDTNKMLSFLYEKTHAQSHLQFLVFYGMFVAGMTLVSNSIGALSLWKLNKYSIEIGSDIQKRIYDGYLNNHYLFFSKNNSSRLISVLTLEVPRFVYNVAQPMLTLIAELFIAIIIVLGLLALNPIIAILSATIVGGVYLLIYSTVRRGVVNAGNIATQINQKRLLLLNESISGIKEIKLIHSEKWYSQEFEDTNRKGLNAAAFIALAGDIPRFLVETTVFIAIIVLSIYLLQSSDSPGETIAILGVYAMAAYKLLPSAQTIYKSTSLIKANGMIVFELLEELENNQKSLTSKADSSEIIPLPKERNIEFNKISFTYPGSNEPAVKNLDLVIREKGITSFVGGSGAGKSTIIDLLLGLINPCKGQVTVGGTSLSIKNIEEWQRSIGYVPQHIFLADDSILKNVALGIPHDQIDLERATWALDQACLSSLVEGLPDGINTKIGEKGGQLSGGQRQRLGIARALYRKPKLLIFDEATSALDGLTEKQIMENIMKLSESITIVMVAHRLSTVVDSDKICVMNNGKLESQGTFEELKRSSPYFQTLLKASTTEEH